jgi:2-haloalkanoic acid dehalogenase type II
MAYEVITFDCYGTLIDWESGITRAVVAAARADGIKLNPEAVLKAHAEIEPAIEARGYRSYRKVLEGVVIETARRLGWSLDPSRAAFLPDSVADWRPFPDAVPALRKLKKDGSALGILSNIDDDLLRGTLKQIDVGFDFLVTAEELHSYKPAPAHFERARELVGERPWLHVAQSYFHDIDPAARLGIPVVWVNRKRDAPSGAALPIAEVPDLTGVVEWLDSRAD